MRDEGAYNFNGLPLPGLSKLVEESGELQQLLGKLIATNGNGAHWDGSLWFRLEQEIGDVYAALDFVTAHWDQLRPAVIEERRDKKYDLFREWNRTG